MKRMWNSITKSPWFRIGYNTVFRVCLINYVFPVVLLVITTLIILQSLRAYRKRRLNITKVQDRNQGREDRKLNVMVIVIVLVFLMCHAGYPVTRFIKDTGINSHQGIPCPIVVFHTFSALFNPSINCLIYITLNRSFRTTLCDMMRPHCGMDLCLHCFS